MTINNLENAEKDNGKYNDDIRNEIKNNLEEINVSENISDEEMNNEVIYNSNTKDNDILN